MSNTIINEMIDDIIDNALWQSFETNLQPDVDAKLKALHEIAEQNEILPAGYKQYIESAEWASRRMKFLEFYGHRCTVCFAQEDLHIHHRYYTEFRKESTDTCTVLCERCHALVHPKGQLPYQWFDKKYPNMRKYIEQTLTLYNLCEIPIEIWQVFSFVSIPKDLYVFK